MDTSALITMIIGMVIIWGGLAASIWWAVRAGRRRGPDHVDAFEEERS